MILGVNGIRLVGSRSGVARAIEHVLLQLDHRQHPFESIRVYTPAPMESGVRLPRIAENIVLPSRLPNGLWEQITLPLAHGSKDILFCPSYVAPVLARCPIVLAHHGSYEGYRDAHKVFSWWARSKAGIAYRLSAHRADALSTVSEFSRKDMARYYRIPQERIQVIPEGVDTQLFRPIDNQRLLRKWRQNVLGEDIPFLLYVGKPTKRRNIPNLLRALQRLDLPHKLVLIGTALPGTTFDRTIDTLGIRERVITIPYASQQELVMAYNAADLFLYPSSYEGFGMPVLEAMACGTPVIALDNTAFPEFSGGIARLLPDANVETLIHGIQALLKDTAERQRMSREGPLRAARYDWSRIADQYIRLICSLVR